MLYESTATLPIKFWWDIHENHDPRILAKDKNIDGDKMHRFCYWIWDGIQDEHIDKHGLTQDFLEYWDAFKDLSVLRAEFALSGDRYDEMMMEIAQRDFDALFKDVEVDNLKNVAIMGKHFGYRIDVMQTSVDEYYANLKLIEETTITTRANG